MPSGSVQRKTLINAVTSPLLHHALASLIKDIPDLRLVGSARDALETFTLIQSLRPDMLILDSCLAVPLKSLMHTAAHKPRVLLLSSRHHAGTDPPCGKYCACGFARDRAPVTHIQTMLRMIAKCEVPHPKKGLASCEKCPTSDSLAPPKLPLSDRQYEVFVRIGHGESNSAMASALGISVKTIETHREFIKRKLGLASAHALVKAAIKWGDGEFTFDDVLTHGTASQP